MPRWFVLAGLVTIAACSHGSKGPAWPTTAKVDEDHPDGGESLEPTHSESVAAVESPAGADDAIDVLLAAMADVQEAAALATPPGAGATDGSEEPITTEEIIIEINGDDDDDGD